MDLPKMSLSDGGMLDGIKAKFGFSSRQSYDDGYYDDDYDDYNDYGADYDDYGEYGDGGYGQPADDAASRYEPHHTVSTRSASAYSRSGSRPRLVSIDDVRARTQVPDSLNRDPLPPRHVTSPAATRIGAFRGNRTVIDGTLPSTADSIAEAQAISAKAMAGRERSESLDNLFASTAEAAAASASAAAPTPSTSEKRSSRGFDPYEAYSGSGAARHVPTRSVTVIKPMSYGEAERVAKSLKAGDAVVLALRNTPEPLVKRLLDFSFGVASALDASVDCIADKVFALTKGAALSESERTDLRNQGVI
ncbi:MULTISPECIES: cell division protein SepF [unclassified Adlercreutzia]|uniref:cell division protein SepF n=1 Tax=unclassified Adlercreutzia TaxID=2636013 RepID=UPI0013ECA4A1|nr:MULTISPECIES: cell division protein SepF [unclassified Adlercreutzia]